MCYEWDRDAFLYWRDHQYQYPTSQTSEPASPLVPIPNAKKPTTGPTTRPFAEVKEDARQKVLIDDADKLQKNIEQRILSLLGADYQNYKLVAATQTATTAVTTPTHLGGLSIARISAATGRGDPETIWSPTGNPHIRS